MITTAADSARSVFAADVDGDGDTDVLSADDDSKIAWYENRGGQFALPTTDTAQRFIAGEQVEGLFAIEVHHRDRIEDGDLELATLELLIEVNLGRVQRARWRGSRSVMQVARRGSTCRRRSGCLG